MNIIAPFHTLPPSIDSPTSPSSFLSPSSLYFLSCPPENDDFTHRELSWFNACSGRFVFVSCRFSVQCATTHRSKKKHPTMSASAPRPTSARPLPRPGSASQRPPSAAGGQGSPPGTTTRVRYRGDRDAQGLPHGEGTLVTDRVVYKGEFQHGKFHGKGSMNRLNITMSTPQVPTDGSVAPPPTPTFELVWSYVGDFDNMKRHGYGKLVLGSQQISELSYPEAEYLLREAAGLGSASGQPAPASSSSSSPPADAIPQSYEGDFHADEMRGCGTWIMATGVYVGQVLQNLRQGKGRMLYPNGSAYTGEWDVDSMHGKGRLIEPNGTFFDGRWTHGNMNGLFHMTKPSGSVYKRQYLDGRMVKEEKVKSGSTWIARTFLNGNEPPKRRLHDLMREAEYQLATGHVGVVLPSSPPSQGAAAATPGGASSPPGGTQTTTPGRLTAATLTRRPVTAPPARPDPKVLLSLSVLCAPLSPSPHGVATATPSAASRVDPMSTAVFGHPAAEAAGGGETDSSALFVASPRSFRRPILGNADSSQRRVPDAVAATAPPSQSAAANVSFGICVEGGISDDEGTEMDDIGCGSPRVRPASAAAVMSKLASMRSVPSSAEAAAAAEGSEGERPFRRGRSMKHAFDDDEDDAEDRHAVDVAGGAKAPSAEVAPTRPRAATTSNVPALTVVPLEMRPRSDTALSPGALLQAGQAASAEPSPRGDGELDDTARLQFHAHAKRNSAEAMSKARLGSAERTRGASSDGSGDFFTEAATAADLTDVDTARLEELKRTLQRMAVAPPPALESSHAAATGASTTAIGAAGTSTAQLLRTATMLRTSKPAVGTGEGGPTASAGASAQPSGAPDSQNDGGFEQHIRERNQSMLDLKAAMALERSFRRGGAANAPQAVDTGADGPAAARVTSPRRTAATAERPSVIQPYAGILLNDSIVRDNSFRSSSVALLESPPCLENATFGPMMVSTTNLSAIRSPQPATPSAASGPPPPLSLGSFVSPPPTLVGRSPDSRPLSGQRSANAPPLKPSAEVLTDNADDVQLPRAPPSPALLAKLAQIQQQQQSSAQHSPPATAVASPSRSGAPTLPPSRLFGESPASDAAVKTTPSSLTTPVAGRRAGGLPLSPSAAASPPTSSGSVDPPAALVARVDATPKSPDSMASPPTGAVRSSLATPRASALVSPRGVDSLPRGESSIGLRQAKSVRFTDAMPSSPELAPQPLLGSSPSSPSFGRRAAPAA